MTRMPSRRIDMYSASCSVNSSCCSRVCGTSSYECNTGTLRAMQPRYTRCVSVHRVMIGVHANRRSKYKCVFAILRLLAGCNRNARQGRRVVLFVVVVFTRRNCRCTSTSLLLHTHRNARILRFLVLVLLCVALDMRWSRDTAHIGTAGQKIRRRRRRGCALWKRHACTRRGQQAFRFFGNIFFFLLLLFLLCLSFAYWGDSLARFCFPFLAAVFARILAVVC